MAMPITKFYTGHAPDPGATPGQSAAYMFPRAPQGAPAPSGGPAPAGVPMQQPGAVPASYGGSPAAAPAMAPQTPASAPAQAPVAAYVSPPPANGGIGKNGFGLHPDTTMDHITDYLMNALKNHESQGNYKAENPHSTATGAYQVTRDTWGNYKGFPRAADADPAIQDEWAKQNIGASVKKFGGDLFKAAANHYYPAWAHDPTKWNEVPLGKNGAPIKGAETITQYLQKVLPSGKVSQYLAGVGNGAS